MVSVARGHYAEAPARALVSGQIERASDKCWRDAFSIDLS
jgi:hypothetical protein